MKTKKLAYLLLSLILLVSMMNIQGCGHKKKSSNDATSTAETSVPVETTAAITTTAVEVTTATPKDEDYVRIKDYIPDIIIDLKYATADNFTHQIIYNFTDGYLRYGTVKKLSKVQAELKAKGYCLKIWDAYRPYEAQQKLWEVYPNGNYVADPRRGLTSHSLGATVDITIVSLDGSEIPMPTGFDDFSLYANRDYSDIDNPIAVQNVLALQTAMYNNGFTGEPDEWWDYSDTDKYEAVDFTPPKTQEIPEVGTTAKTEEATTATVTTTTTSAANTMASFPASLSLASSHSQMIIVSATGSRANVSMYTKTSSGDWSKDFSTDNAWVGKDGVGAASEYASCSPRGVYTLGKAFGIYANPGCTRNYIQVDDTYYWVDDPSSPYYNKFVTTKETAVNWTSAEHIIDYPACYQYVVSVDYNMDCTPGAGSAIFLHVSNGTPTLGCVAIPEEYMKLVLTRLQDDCVIIIDDANNIANY